MALEVLQRRLQQGRAAAVTGSVRASQRAYVGFMFDLIGQLLAAASGWDDEVREEAAGFPEGLIFGFSVLGSDARLRLRAVDGRLEMYKGEARPDLDIAFKHISHAFMVFSFQESTPEAFANQRTVVQGDTSLAMRFVRCLNRVQSVVLPEAVARRALKAVPPIGVGHKLSLNARLYADLARTLANRSQT